MSTRLSRAALLSLLLHLLVSIGNVLNMRNLPLWLIFVGYWGRARFLLGPGNIFKLIGELESRVVYRWILVFLMVITLDFVQLNYVALRLEFFIRIQFEKMLQGTIKETPRFDHLNYIYLVL